MLVEDNKIQTISSEPIAVTAVGDLTVIDGNNRTLMPGLSDAHWPFNIAITDPIADNTYRLAKRYNIKTAWGTDVLFDPRLASRQLFQLTKMVRWYEPWEVLKMATHDNQELFALSGPRNPYPGKLAVVEEGALADLLLVNGNPLENIQLIEDPEQNFLVIMKDGKIYKNLLS